MKKVVSDKYEIRGRGEDVHTQSILRKPFHGLPREEAVEGHLDDGLLHLVLVQYVAVFVVKLSEDLHGVVKVLDRLGRCVT